MLSEDIPGPMSDLRTARKTERIGGVPPASFPAIGVSGGGPLSHKMVGCQTIFWDIFGIMHLNHWSSTIFWRWWNLFQPQVIETISVTPGRSKKQSSEKLRVCLSYSNQKGLLQPMLNKNILESVIRITINSIIITNHHQSSSIIINHHQSSSININHHSWFQSTNKLPPFSRNPNLSKSLSTLRFASPFSTPAIRPKSNAGGTGSSAVALGENTGKLPYDLLGTLKSWLLHRNFRLHGKTWTCSHPFPIICLDW